VGVFGKNLGFFLGIFGVYKDPQKTDNSLIVINLKWPISPIISILLQNLRRLERKRINERHSIIKERHSL